VFSEAFTVHVCVGNTGSARLFSAVLHYGWLYARKSVRHCSFWCKLQLYYIVTERLLILSLVYMS